jgi:hypothetical protein
MTDEAPDIAARPPLVPDLVVRAEALLRRPSTPSDLAEELDRALRLARAGDAEATTTLSAAVSAASGFRHIIPSENGFALSIYVRELLDSATQTLESSSVPPDAAARIRDAESLIAQGREDGVLALEVALRWKA